MSNSDCITLLVIFTLLFTYAIWNFRRARRKRLIRQSRPLQQTSRATAVILPRAIAIADKSDERPQVLNATQQTKLYTESRLINIELKNAQLQNNINQLSHLLNEALSNQSNPFSIRSLKASIVKPVPSDSHRQLEIPIEPPHLTLPPELTGVQKMSPIARKKYEVEVAALTRHHEIVLAQHTQRERERVSALEREADKFAFKRSEYLKQLDDLDDLNNDFKAAKPAAIVEYFTLVLGSSTYPDNFPHGLKLAYMPESKQLIVEYDLPGLEVVPEVLEYKYVAKTNEVTSKPRPEKQRKSMYASIVSQIALRVLYELFQADTLEYLDTIVFNGVVDAIDKGTGRAVRPCLVTVRTTRDIFHGLDLAKVDPDACLKVLSASVSKSPAELTPVRPVLEFNMVDPRFVEEVDVLSTLDQRPNLMELTPSEFESLITNLFEKMGLETRQTQASRDGGVDCVAYDPRPILGGKIVIQAKRYKHTVGVSAVRDLFGTMHNEGASKGILVTTSGFGKASFDFANDKPIELLSGSNLLFLLSEHAGLEAKIVPPESWRDPQADLSNEPIYDPKKPTE